MWLYIVVYTHHDEIWHEKVYTIGPHLREKIWPRSGMRVGTEAPKDKTIGKNRSIRRFSGASRLFLSHSPFPVLPFPAISFLSLSLSLPFLPISFLFAPLPFPSLPFHFPNLPLSVIFRPFLPLPFLLPIPPFPSSPEQWMRVNTCCRFCGEYGRCLGFLFSCNTYIF